MKLVDMTLDAYIQELGSDSPAPGGGSASALCGGQGAALIAMVAGLTLGKKKYAEHQTLCAEVQAAAHEERAWFLQQVDRDTAAFLTLAQAFKLPKETEEQKQARSAAIQQGTLLSAQAPFETMQHALSTIGLAHQLVEKSNASAASDLGVAALNLVGCCGGAWLNVLINLGGLKDEAAVRHFRQEGQRINEEVSALGTAIYNQISASM